MDQTELQPASDATAPAAEHEGAQPGDPDESGGRGPISAADRRLRETAGSVLARCPWLEPPLQLLRDRYTRWWIRGIQLRHNLLHSAPIDPYRIAWVDPSRIEYIAKKDSRPRFKRVGTVEDGDWDARVRQFTETALYRGFEARFEHGRAWEDTEFYRRVLDQLEAGETRWNCSTRDDLDERCRRLEEFYRSVQDGGLMSQRELVTDDVQEPISRDRETTHARVVNDEVAVDIGRRGGLLFADGRNRLAVAKLLDLDEMPVLFLRRHPKWVAFRDAVADHVAATGVLPDAVAEHPDLRQLGDG